MSLLNELIGQVTGGAGQGSGSLQNIVASLLSDSQSNAPGASGGLNGLLARFAQVGLQDVAQSWVGNGANQPVTPDQVNQALGEQKVQAMSAQTGMPKDQLLALLAEHLPKLVDRATPEGKVPDDDPFAGPGVAAGNQPNQG